MSRKTKIRKIGNSLGIVLPKEVIEAMKVKEGDALYITESPDHAVNITPEQPGFAEKSEKARDLMRRYRNALKELAQ